MHVSLCYAPITYCRGQACRRPNTYDFPTLAAIELRVLVDSKSGAASFVSVSAAVDDPQRLRPGSPQLTHSTASLFLSVDVGVTFPVTLVLASLAVCLATSLARRAFQLVRLLLLSVVCNSTALPLTTSAHT